MTFHLSHAVVTDLRDLQSAQRIIRILYPTS